MAAQQVLETYELLEDVILHLPVVKILVMQRVCKAWLSLTQDSDRIQKALFLRPVAGRDKIAFRHKTTFDNVPGYPEGSWCSIAGTSMLEKRKLGRPNYGYPHRLWSSTSPLKVAHPVLNPFFRHVHQTIAEANALLDRERESETLGLTPTAEEGWRRLQAVSRSEASWLKGLLLQPPVIEVVRRAKGYIPYANGKFFSEEHRSSYQRRTDDRSPFTVRSFRDWDVHSPHWLIPVLCLDEALSTFDGWDQVKYGEEDVTGWDVLAELECCWDEPTEATTRV